MDSEVIVEIDVEKGKQQHAVVIDRDRVDMPMGLTWHTYASLYSSPFLLPLAMHSTTPLPSTAPHPAQSPPPPSGSNSPC